MSATEKEYVATMSNGASIIIWSTALRWARESADCWARETGHTVRSVRAAN